MENEITVHASNTPVNLAQIAADINAIKNQVKETVYIATCRIGEKLLQAKGAVGHGNWGKWLEENVDYSERTAQNIITIYKNFNNTEMKLFGSEPDPELLAQLNQTQLLALSSVKDEDKRNMFMEEHKEELPDMSKRELEKALRELENEKAAREEAEEEIINLRNELVNGDNEELEELKDKYRKLQQELIAMDAKHDKATKESKRYQDLFAEAQERIKELEERPADNTIEATIENSEEIEARDMEIKAKERELVAKESELISLKKRIQELEQGKGKSREEKQFVRHYENALQEIQEALVQLSYIDGESKYKYGVAIRKLAQQVLDNTDWAESQE